MAFLKDRVQAGSLLAEKLKAYQGKEVVVLGLPRGGVVLAAEIAKSLNALLDLTFAHKVGHPMEPEFAIAAVSEGGQVVGEASSEAITQVLEEIKERRKLYLKGKPKPSLKGKIAILVDDGIATGLTMEAAILDVRAEKPKELIVAVPVSPKSTADRLGKQVDQFVALRIDANYLGGGKSMTLLFTLPPCSPQKEPIHIERFSNGELHLAIESDVENIPCTILGSIAPPDSNLFTYLALVHTLKKEGAKKCTAMIPYLWYMRHDHDEPKKSRLAALLASLFAASGIDEIVTVDVHSQIAKNLFPMPLHSLSPAPIFIQKCKDLSFFPDTVVSPDEGGVQRASAVAQAFSSPVAHIQKKRTDQGVIHFSLIGEVGKKVLIIDDILDSGGTLISCVKHLKTEGVEEIQIMVTHGLFTGKKWKELWDLRVQGIYCTDSVPGKKYDGVEVLPLEPILEPYWKR